MADGIGEESLRIRLEHRDLSTITDALILFQPMCSSQVTLGDEPLYLSILVADPDHLFIDLLTERLASPQVIVSSEALS